MRLTIADYGVGNLHSLAKAFSREDVTLTIETEPERLIDTDALVLPGVGAFDPAARHLARAREDLRAALARGLPCLGICLGMQLLFDTSEEGDASGLGIIPGRVRRLSASRVPQMGWNTVDALPSQSGLGLPPIAYYANSFVCEPTDPACVAAWSTHESDRFVAAVRVGSTTGVQFHPEKSADAGRAFLDRWLSTVAP